MATEKSWPIRNILVTARQVEGISQGDAAGRAGWSVGKWRSVELGYLTPGGGERVPYTPSDEDLVIAAEAVGKAPVELFDALGRTYSGPATTPVERPEKLLTEARILFQQGLSKVEAAVRVLGRDQRAPE